MIMENNYIQVAAKYIFVFKRLYLILLHHLHDQSLLQKAISVNFYKINEKSLDVGCCNMVISFSEYCNYYYCIICMVKSHYNKLFLPIYIYNNENLLNAGSCNMVSQFL